MYKRIFYGLLIVTSVLAADSVDEAIIKDLDFFKDMEMVEQEFVDVSQEMDSKLLTAEMEIKK